MTIGGVITSLGSNSFDECPSLEGGVEGPVGQRPIPGSSITWQTDEYIFLVKISYFAAIVAPLNQAMGKQIADEEWQQK